MQELTLLDDEANVYKLVGPALIKQDPVEAKSNVQKRLDYINGELSRLEGQLKGLDEKNAKKQQEVPLPLLAQPAQLSTKFCHLFHSLQQKSGLSVALPCAPVIAVANQRRGGTADFEAPAGWRAAAAS